MNNKKLTPPINYKELKRFTQVGKFEVYTTDEKLTGIGLAWGEGSRLQVIGYTRKEQIRMLNYLQEHPTIAKKLLKY